MSDVLTPLLVLVFIIAAFVGAIGVLGVMHNNTVKDCSYNENGTLVGNCGLSDRDFNQSQQNNQLATIPLNLGSLLVPMLFVVCLIALLLFIGGRK